MRRLLEDDERSVSDVLGSILLVGITVVMAAAFGAVLLAFDGPSDKQHTQLSVAVGPGADGDWGTNDAELKIIHVGGEPLRQQDVTIVYSDTTGSHTVTPTFVGGELAVGGTWTQTISASPGVAVDVSVLVDVGTSNMIIHGGNVAAGGTGAALTYVAALTPASGKGTVTNFANMQSAIDSNAAGVLTEGSSGGSSSTIPPTTATSFGASNTNVLSSNDVRAALDLAGEWVQGASFTDPSGITVAAISIGMEARAIQTTSTIALVGSAVTGTWSSGLNVATSTTVTAAASNIYIAAVAGRAVSGTADVTGVTGMGVTWTPAGQATSSTGVVEVFIATGSATTGTVTAAFGTAVNAGAISVTRYTGIDTTTPVLNSAINSGSGNALLGTAVTGTATTGRFFVAVNGGGTGSIAFASPVEATDQRADVDSGGVVQLGVADMASSASNTLAGTFTSNPTWQALSIQLKPAVSPLPQVKLSYTFSGCVTCTTTITPTLTTGDVQYTQSILADRSWSPGNIDGIAVRATYETSTGSIVEIDQVYLTVTVTTSGSTAFLTQADFSFSGVPDLPTQSFELRYKTSGDTFTVYAMTGAVERACPGVINSATFAVFTCTLQGSEYNSGAPVLRIKDATPGVGGAEGAVTIDYARMATS